MGSGTSTTAVKSSGSRSRQRSNGRGQLISRRVGTARSPQRSPASPRNVRWANARVPSTQVGVDYSRAILAAQPATWRHYSVMLCGHPLTSNGE